MWTISTMGIAAMLLLGSAAAQGATTPDDNDDYLTDEEVIGILATASKGELQLGRIAEQKAVTEPVESFAEKMVTDHSAALWRLARLSEQPGLLSTESPLSIEMRAQAQKQRRTLKQIRRGVSFDLTYMCGQISLHAQVLDTIDGWLIDDTEDPRVDTEVRTTRARVRSYLDEARHIVREMIDEEPDKGCESRGL